MQWPKSGQRMRKLVVFCLLALLGGCLMSVSLRGLLHMHAQNLIALSRLLRVFSKFSRYFLASCFAFSFDACGTPPCTYGQRDQYQVGSGTAQDGDPWHAAEWSMEVCGPSAFSQPSVAPPPSPRLGCTMRRYRAQNPRRRKKMHSF